MLEKAVDKLMSIITEPTQVVLLAWIGFMIRENWAIQKINEKLLKAQEDSGLIMAKIGTMVEALFQDLRRPK